jgi:predicted pyridoxine 5'-phosphate oxidase superfamily flavin-nucleotide-binding protein
LWVIYICYVVQLYSPYFDEQILMAIADMRIDASLLPSELHDKVLKLLDNKIGLDKFKLEEKIVLACSLGLDTYIHTIKHNKDKSVLVVKDLLPSLRNQFEHRQINAIAKLQSIEMAVLSPKDIVRHMESVYFVQNKPAIVALAKDYNALKTSSLIKQKDINDLTQRTIDNTIKFISAALSAESSVLLELKINKSQYKLLITLYASGVSLFQDLYRNMEGSPKKRHEDYRKLEEMRFIQTEQIENKKTKTTILTYQGKLGLFNAIKKFIC